VNAVALAVVEEKRQARRLYDDHVFYTRQTRSDVRENARDIM
jgi:hypothetical protein